MQTWCDLWQLELDREKSYLWATNNETRQDAQVLGWKVCKAAKDLGAQMNYGRSRQVTVVTDRIASLEHLWPKLKRCSAPRWHKLRLLKQGFWPKAFYGTSVCTLGWSHIRLLRTEAMKALNYKKAGASPVLRLGLIHDEQCDPGFYQVWQVLLNFKRIAKKRPMFVQLRHDY